MALCQVRMILPRPTSIPDIPRVEGAGDEAKIELRTHTGRMGTAFFDALAKEQGQGVGFADTDTYVCGPDEFEKMVADVLVAFGAERERIIRDTMIFVTNHRSLNLHSELAPRFNGLEKILGSQILWEVIAYPGCSLLYIMCPFHFFS
jgi:hypothetical protein